MEKEIVPKEDIPDGNQGDVVPKEDIPEQQTAPGDVVPKEDVPYDQAQGEPVPKEDMPTDYGTTGQELLTGIEGAAQGIAGPLATLAETKLLGVNPEDISGRAKENPWIHGLSEAGAMTAGLMTGQGIPGAIAKGTGMAAEALGLSKIGSTVFKGFLDGMALQGSDEITKAILGQGSPQEPVGSALLHIGGAGLLGGVTGGLFGMVGEKAMTGLKAIENQKMGSGMQSFLNGVGGAHKGLDEDALMNLSFDSVDPKSFDRGVKFYNETGPEFFAKAGVRAVGVEALKHLTGMGGGESIAIESTMQKALEKVLKKPLLGVSKRFVMPVLGKAMASNSVNNIVGMLDYATTLNKSVQSVNSGLDSIFKAGGQQTLSGLYDDIDRDKDKIKSYVEEGGYPNEIQNALNESGESSSPGYAEGGVVSEKTNDFANAFPAENTLMNSAKSRIYNYLNNARPMPPSGNMPFDTPTKSKAQEKAYDRALTVAARPLTVLKHIKDGTLTSEHVKHLSQMYPESYDYLSKKMSERMAKYGIQEENKPSFKTRQALSLFLTTPLEKSFTPTSIQAAQSVFMPKAPQQPAQGAPKMKRDTAKLGSKTDNMYQTQLQESERDRSDRK
jgi:hypothetical protein